MLYFILFFFTRKDGNKVWNVQKNCIKCIPTHPPNNQPSIQPTTTPYSNPTTVKKREAFFNALCTWPQSSQRQQQQQQQQENKYKIKYIISLSHVCNLYVSRACIQPPPLLSISRSRTYRAVGYLLLLLVILQVFN